MHRYQILVGSLNWIATYTRPDLTPVVTFPSDYNYRHSPDHLKAALYTLRYLHSTAYLVINFSSIVVTEHHYQIHHPFPNDLEAYLDASAPTPTYQNKILSYSAA